MKFYSAILILACLSLGACKGAVQDAQYPQGAVQPPPPSVPPRSAVCEPRDNFDKAGQLAADGSRWAYEKTKEYSGKAYDAAVKAYNDYQAEKKSKEEKTSNTSEP